jgi:hypothetical protein
LWSQRRSEEPLTWALSGGVLRPVPTSVRAVRIFNIAMAAHVLASLYPALMNG